MDYLAFLESNDRIKLRIIGLIAQANAHHVSLKQLLAELDTTRYKLNKLVSELSQDLANLKLSQCQFSVDDNVITCENADYATYQQLQLVYLKQSPRFQVFQYESLNQSTQSRQKFLMAHYMSQSKFYTLRGQVEKILNRPILVGAGSKQIQLHPELIERIKIDNVYYHFFNGIEDPFPELNREASRFCTVLSMTFGISMTPSQRLKLRIFFQLQVKRLAEGHFMNIRPLVKLTRDDRLIFLKHYYLTYVKRSDESDLESEMSYVFLFLVSQRIMPDAPVKFCAQVHRQVDQESNQFMAVLDQTLVVDQTEFTTALKRIISDRLSKRILWMQVFDYFEIVQVSVSAQPHLLINFPALTILGRQLVDVAMTTFEIQLSGEQKTGLLKSFVQVLVEEIPSQLIRDNVTICVDFVRNLMPADYFSELLAANLGEGVVLTDQLSHDVDIYLSDIFVSSIRDIPQVTWLDPLRSSNWDKLRQQIAQVKRMKLRRLLTAM